MNRTFFIALLAIMLAGCALKTSGSAAHNHAYGFANPTVWIKGCVQDTQAVAQTLADHNFNFERCVDVPHEEVAGFGIYYHSDDELQASVRIYEDGIPFRNAYAVHGGSKKAECYREAMEQIGFPEAVCKGGYKVTYYPDRNINEQVE